MVSTTAAPVPEPAVKSKHGISSDTNYLEGLKIQELNMIRKLAGNDSLVRKRTIRRLRKWLSTIVFKIPDSPDSKDAVDPNFIRVWKALFYCMWMADKPLPQEQLAEQISNLITIFSPKPNVMMFFVDWFFLTISREWPWIDRFRLDKFMMLIRRFLRKSLEQLSLRNWDKELLVQFNRIVSVHIFNRQERPVTRKTRSRGKILDHPKAPLGFQIHFTDIFLEELAKVGATTLKSNHTMQIISPFIYELAYNDDDRLLSEIRERIFCHLVQQSDAALDYLDSVQDQIHEDEDCEGFGSDMINGNTKEEDAMELGDDESNEDEEDYTQPLDPRAGQVDVVLPQIEISYGDLALKLIESGGQKDVKRKNKNILYALARDLNKVTAGIYPLALPEEGPRNPAIKKKEVEMAAERLVTLEEDLCSDKHNRKTKKARKRELKQMQSGDEGLTTDTPPANPPKAKKHTPDAIALPCTPKPAVKKKEIQMAAERSVALEEDLCKFKPNVKTKKAKKREFKQMQSGDEGLTKDSPPPKPPKAKKDTPDAIALSCTPKPAVKRKEIQMAAQRSVALEEDLCKFKPSMKTKKARKREFNQMQNGDKGLTKDSPPAKSPKAKRHTQEAITLPRTPKPEEVKKRVSFVLARNLEHPHSDYQDSIQRSPAIPYDSRKQPNFGLLKPLTPTSTPQTHLQKTLQTLQRLSTTPRKRAADFF